MEITAYTVTWVEEDRRVVELYFDEDDLKFAERTLKDDGIEYQVDVHRVQLRAA